MKNFRWFYILLGLIINLCLGTVYAWSVFRSPLEELLGIGATASGLPYMVFLAAFAFSMPLGGYVLSKVGPRYTVMIGGVLVGLGWLLTSYLNSIGLITISYGVIAGMGVGITYGAPLAVAAKWFPEKKGLALGLTLVGFGLSAFITAPLARSLIEAEGVMPTFRIFGIAFLLIIIVLAQSLRLPKQKSTEKADMIQNKNLEGIQVSPKEMFKTRQFYGLWICFIIGTLAGLMAIGITSPVGVTEFALTASAAAFATSVFAIFNGIGRPIFGALTDKIGVRNAAVFSFILMIAASVLVLLGGDDTVFLYYISFAIFWMILGGWLAIAPAATNTLFGAENYSKNYGFMYTAYGIGAIGGSLLSGWMKDNLGSYLKTFYPLIGLAVIGIVLAMVLLRPVKEKQLAD
ncbi:MAG: OFA family MFS transporter [Candidatus Zixiibacteriota bacterium]